MVTSRISPGFALPLTMASSPGTMRTGTWIDSQRVSSSWMLSAPADGMARATRSASYFSTREGMS